MWCLLFVAVRGNAVVTLAKVRTSCLVRGEDSVMMIVIMVCDGDG